MVKLDNTTLLMIAGGALLVAVVVWFFFFRDPKPSHESMAALRDTLEAVNAARDQRPIPPASAPPQQSGSGSVLILFYGDHCPHCHNMMPAWAEVKKMLAGKMGVMEIEGQDPKMANFVPPKGVPTVRYYPGGPENQQNFIDYSGDRSAQSLVNFALSGGQQ